MPVIVVTLLRLRDPALLDEFFTDAVVAIEQAMKSDGNCPGLAMANRCSGCGSGPRPRSPGRPAPSRWRTRTYGQEANREETVKGFAPSISTWPPRSGLASRGVRPEPEGGTGSPRRTASGCRSSR
jgi:hypothetical protein